MTFLIMEIQTIIRKRKRVVLSLIEKFEIINRLKNGETAVSLANEFNIGLSTIGDIKKSEVKLVKYMTEMENCVFNRKSMRSSKDEKLDSALYQWFSERRNEGEIVTGPEICEKALELNEQLGGSNDFKASTGWLQRFKIRHGIKISGDHYPWGCHFVNGDILKRFDEYIKKEQKDLRYEESSVRKEQDELSDESPAMVSVVETNGEFTSDFKHIDKAKCFHDNDKDDEKVVRNEGSSINLKQEEIEKDELLYEPCVNLNIIETNYESTSNFNDSSHYEEVKKVGEHAQYMPSNREALAAIHTVLKWCENQDEVDSVLLYSLNRIRDIAAKKTLSNFLT